MTVTLANSTVGQRTQLGIQSSSGTGVAATRRMPTLSITPAPETEANKYRAQGNKFTSVLVPNKEWSTFKGEGVASYGEMPFILTSLLAGATGTTNTGVTTWTIQPTDGAPDTPQLYTIEHGTSSTAVQTIDNVITDFGLEFNRSGIKVTAGGIGKAFTTGFSLTGQAAVWTATITGTPTGGTFTLTFNSQTTSAIAYNATGATVQTAFLALSSVGAGNATVTGSAGGPYTISLIGALNGSPLAITASGASLTGGTSPGVTMAQTANGVNFYEDKPIQPGQVTVYLDTSYAGIGGTALTNILSGKFDLTGRWGPEWILNASNSSYYQLVELEPKSSASFMLEVGSNAMAHFADYRAGTLLYLQIKAVGALISGSTHYSFTLNVPVQFGKLQELKDEGGVYAIGFDLEPISDPTAGFPVQAVVVNATSAL